MTENMLLSIILSNVFSGCTWKMNIHKEICLYTSEKKEI